MTIRMILIAAMLLALASCNEQITRGAFAAGADAATKGAAAGTAFGPEGTVVGGVVGLLAGALGMMLKNWMAQRKLEADVEEGTGRTLKKREE